MNHKLQVKDVVGKIDNCVAKLNSMNLKVDSTNIISATKRFLKYRDLTML